MADYFFRLQLSGICQSHVALQYIKQNLCELCTWLYFYVFSIFCACVTIYVVTLTGWVFCFRFGHPPVSPLCVLSLVRSVALLYVQHCKASSDYDVHFFLEKQSTSLFTYTNSLNLHFTQRRGIWNFWMNWLSCYETWYLFSWRVVSHSDIHISAHE